jgi:anthranilate synthase/indole-3-glycerol phosphate synthase/phosphoribosylanthranilate isomerase
MSDILETIVAKRREDVAARKVELPFPEVRARLPEAPPVIDFRERLRNAGPMAVMAEIKRASPSKGDIAPGINADEQARQYARAGAAAISVLTEPTWFKGTLHDLQEARWAMDEFGPARPAILRKDFIVDEYQIFEARLGGADSVLLIVSCLGPGFLEGYMDMSRALGMEPLVEVNSEEEMERAVKAGAQVIGVNNRNLRTFDVEMETTERLAGMVPRSVILAALSGIATRADVERYERAGARAVLVGESLMRAEDPRTKIRELVGA